MIIKCFGTPKAKYFYDRYTNSVVRVNNAEYVELLRIEAKQIITDNEKLLEKYSKCGLLKESIIEEIEHPESTNLKHLAENCMSQLILQVTQQCNLRCHYCAYSGNYFNREHSSQRMNFETAQKAIDFYFSRTRESDDLAISFYGGEPLLEFPLIEKCVAYCIKCSGDKAINFNMTTNGTLLTEEVTSFLINHKFLLTISLDGAKEEHDANRKFSNGKGSFDGIIENLKRIKNKDIVYYNSNIYFNAVINPRAKLSCVHEYFTTNDLFLDGHVTLNSLATAGLMDANIVEFDEKHWMPQSYEHLKLLLSLIGKIDNKKTSPLVRSSKKKIEQLYRNLHEHSIESRKMHHGGPCVPGVRRLFVTTGGKLYPCERVSECVEKMCIGTLDSGFNYSNMKFLMNNGKLTEKECLNCWNLRQCTICLGQVDPEDAKIIKTNKLKKCEESKLNTLQELRELSVLIELGYKIPAEE